MLSSYAILQGVPKYDYFQGLLSHKKTVSYYKESRFTCFYEAEQR